MTEPSQLDLQRAREITNLYGGNGLSTTQSERLVAEKLAEWRSDLSTIADNLADALDGFLGDGDIEREVAEARAVLGAYRVIRGA